jgi:hypothetical protein
MRKAFLVLAVALTFLLSAALPASAGTGWLKINVEGPGTTSMTPGTKAIYMKMYEGSTVRCKNSGDDVVTVTSSAFDPESKRDDTDGNGLLVLHTYVKPSYGSHPVKATCKGWAFYGTITVKSGSIAFGGVPVLPTAALGLLLVLVGAGALHLARVSRPAGAGSSDGRAVG